MSHAPHSFESRVLTAPERRRRARAEAGEVYLEYLIVLLAIGIPLATTIAATGPGIVKSYQTERAVLLSIDP